MSRNLFDSFAVSEYSDPEQQQKRKVLTLIIYLSLIGAVIFGITSHILHWGGVIPVASAVYIVLATGCLWLIRRGNLHLPGILLPLVLLALVTYQAIRNHGPHDQAILIYPLIITFAWLLLSRRTALVFLLLSLGSAFLVIYLEVNRFIAPRIAGDSEYADLITFAIALGSTAFLSDSIVDNLRGTVRRLRVSERDLRLQAEALAQREAEIRMFIEESPIGICIMNVERRIELINSQACEMLGYTTEEMLGRDSAEFISPNELARLPLPTGDELAHDRPIREERLLTRKDGSTVWVLGNVRRLPNRMFQYSLQDITERKRAESALQRSEDMYRRAIMAAGAVPYYLDHRIHKYTFMGDGILQMTGYTASEMHPDLWSNLEQEGFPRGSLAHLTYEEADRITEEDNSIVWECDYRILTRDGQTRWVADTSVKGLDEHGERVGVIGILQDITDRKNALLEREKLIKDLEARNAELERFTYTVSHDLKSPLVTIQGYLGYIEADALNGNQERLQRDLQRVKDATIRMQSLLRDLLELSRIGRMLNPIEDAPLSGIIREALNNAAGQVETSKATVIVAQEFPTVRADKARLVEVFQNLVDNACKYMGSQPEPRIEIDQRHDDGKTVFYVRDNGMGIEPQYRERIFGLFNKLNPDSEGTGIGLALVKRIIELHGGEIWVESDGKSRGSTFCFTLPNSPESK